MSKRCVPYGDVRGVVCESKVFQLCQTKLVKHFHNKFNFYGFFTILDFPKKNKNIFTDFSAFIKFNLIFEY